MNIFRLVFILLVVQLVAVLFSASTVWGQDRSRFKRGAAARDSGGAQNSNETPANSGSTGRRARLRAGSTPDPNDPTQPSAEIRQRLNAPAETVTARKDVQPQAMNLRSNLPAIPLVVVRSRIMSSPDSGTVTLSASGDSIRIRLDRSSPDDLSFEFPTRQFAEYADAVRQLDNSVAKLDAATINVTPALTATPSESADSALPATAVQEETAPKAEMPNSPETLPLGTASKDLLPTKFSLANTFVLAGLTYRLVDFNDQAVLLEALPHQKLVIAR